MNIHTIFYLKGGGRLGNQLLNWIHLLAYAEEYNFQRLRIVSMGLIKYNSILSNYNTAFFFKNTTNENNYPLFIRLILLLSKYKCNTAAKVVGNVMLFTVFLNPKAKRIKYYASFKHAYFLNSHDFFSKLYKYSKVSLWGWGFRCWDLLEKHEKKIREQLIFNSEHYVKSEKYIAENFTDNPLIVGVLIRHTDYRNEWYNGKYYFETENYIQWIVQLQAVLSEYYKNIKFLICSDEPQKRSQFENRGFEFTFAPGYAIGGGHYIENFYCLSMCQYILSPPSTFSGMAAFIGNTKFILVTSNSDIITKNSILNRHIFELKNHPDGSTSVN